MTFGNNSPALRFWLCRSLRSTDPAQGAWGSRQWCGAWRCRRAELQGCPRDCGHALPWPCQAHDLGAGEGHPAGSPGARSSSAAKAGPRHVVGPSSWGEEAARSPTEALTARQEMSQPTCPSAQPSSCWPLSVGVGRGTFAGAEAAGSTGRAGWPALPLSGLSRWDPGVSGQRVKHTFVPLCPLDKPRGTLRGLLGVL